MGVHVKKCNFYNQIKFDIFLEAIVCNYLCVHGISMGGRGGAGQMLHSIQQELFSFFVTDHVTYIL